MTESTAKFSQSYNVELKTYREHIKELYDILLAQTDFSLKKSPGYDEQFASLKSYLNLQRQIGALKKFRFDIRFY